LCVSERLGEVLKQMLWKKNCFAIGFAIQFLSCIRQLQLTIFIHCECYRTSYNSCKSCNSSYIQCNSLQLCHNNSFSTTMQFPYDYNHNVMLTSFFIHQSKFNTWHYEDFSWLFLKKYWYPSSIMTICFRWFWIMTQGKSCHSTY
jgi:hypothetical protein